LCHALGVHGEPEAAIGVCRAAHQRLLATAAGIDDRTVRRPSRLPGWSVGHVLSHLARNADGHVRRLEGALRAEEVARYPGGNVEREREIEEGASRTAAELLADLTTSAKRLEDTWDRSREAGWPNAGLLASDTWPTSASPLRRLREVEVHHVDLGLGYEASDWPEDYVRWDLPLMLEGLPDRLSGADDARRLLASLFGRAPWPERLELGSW
jgi:maleylpyruvate isomerase